MNNIALLIIKSLHILVVFFMALNYACLILLMFMRFDFFKGKFFIGILRLIFIVLSPIYNVLEKIMQKTIFDGKIFSSNLKDLSLAFIFQLILLQIDFFVKNSI